MFAKDTHILDAFHALASRAGDGLVVDYVLLKPEVWNAEADHIFDDRRHILRGAKDIHEMDAFGIILLRGDMRRFDVGIALEPQHLSECGIHGKDVIALHDEVTPDVMAGAPGLVAHTDDSDGLRCAKHFIDDSRIVHGSAASSCLLARM